MTQPCYRLKRIQHNIPQRPHECPALIYERFVNHYSCNLNHQLCPFAEPTECFRYLELHRSELRAEEEQKDGNR